MIRAWLHLAMLAAKRRGLYRERARLHQYRAGIEWELERNRADAAALAAEMAQAEDDLRRARWSRRFRVAP
jgi:hypothetical protein